MPWNSLPKKGSVTCLSSILRRMFLMACTVTSAGAASSTLSGILLQAHLWQTGRSSLNTSRPNFSFEMKPVCMFKKIQWMFSIYFLNSLLIYCPHSIKCLFLQPGTVGTISGSVKATCHQSINKFISCHSTEVCATVRLCRIKEKCLETDLKCVNGWSSSTVQWKRVPLTLMSLSVPATSAPCRLNTCWAVYEHSYSHIGPDSHRQVEFWFSFPQVQC